MRRPRFTPVPHEVIDEHLNELSHGELKVLLVVLRSTHGWSKESTEIGLQKLVEVTGLSRSNCSDSARSLEGKGLIKRTLNQADDGGGSATTYEPIFEDAPPSSPLAPPVQSESIPPVQPAGRYKEERKSTLEKEAIPPTPSSIEDLDLEDSTEEFLANHSRRNRGPRIKLNRKQDTHVLGRIHQAEQTFGRTGLRLAWVCFVDWWKLGQDVRDPLPYFLGSVKRWTELGDPTTPAIDHPRQELASLPEIYRDYPAEWNRLVPAAATQWDSKHSPTAALRECMGDVAFCQRFDEICSVAQSIHAARGADVSWLTLSWTLKGKSGESPGWFRLLNDLRWMAAPKSELNGLKMSKKDQEIAASLLGARQIRARRLERQRNPQ